MATTYHPVADVASPNGRLLDFTGVDFGAYDIAVTYQPASGDPILLFSTVGLKRADEAGGSGTPVGPGADLTNYYTKPQTQALLADKANESELTPINGTLQQHTQQLAAKADLVGGKVPAAQLPSYVDDVLEFAQLSVFPSTGEAGKIYVAINSGRQYRWSGSGYSQLSDSGLTGDQLAALPVGIGSGNQLVASSDPRLVPAAPYNDTAIKATQQQHTQQINDLDTRVDVLEANQVATRDPYDVPTAKRKAVVDAGAPSVLETDPTYYGCEFVDEVYGPDRPAYYRCAPSAPAQTGGATVWKWFRFDIL